MNALTNESLAQLFTEARSFNGWLQKDLSDETLHQIYDLTKWGPTSANTSPARFVFVKSGPQKEKLLSAVMDMNKEKIKAAPVTVIVATDEKFYDHIPKLFPHAPHFRDFFTADAKFAATSGFRNGSLQGAYFMLAVRALGLDCGPMSGFDNKKLDELFFINTNWKSNFICSIGYGDRTKVLPRLPRLPFEEACKIV
jgi:3-hydroxypropanoate dehydrogenase